MAGRPGCDLSFSGLKTALAQHLRDGRGGEPADVAASYQQAIVDTLLERTLAALSGSGLRTLAVVGGVAANSCLRGAFEEACASRAIELRLAPLSLCADNAAMIAAASRFAEPLPPSRYLALDAYARSPLLSLHATAVNT
jgi:N6-L-threonylcarbamoyladenine synthase